MCEKLREKFPMCDLPIIMVSAKGEPEHVVQGLSKGANDYIAKPIKSNELLARIRAQLMICHTCRMVFVVFSNAPGCLLIPIHNRFAKTRPRETRSSFVTNVIEPNQRHSAGVFPLLELSSSFIFPSSLFILFIWLTLFFSGVHPWILQGI